jgi:hypothetical protein
MQKNTRRVADNNKVSQDKTSTGIAESAEMIKDKISTGIAESAESIKDKISTGIAENAESIKDKTNNGMGLGDKSIKDKTSVGILKTGAEDGKKIVIISFSSSSLETRQSPITNFVIGLFCFLGLRKRDKTRSNRSIK